MWCVDVHGIPIFNGLHWPSVIIGYITVLRVGGQISRYFVCEAMRFALPSVFPLYSLCKITLTSLRAYEVDYE